MTTGLTNHQRDEREQRVCARLAGTGFDQVRWLAETGSTNRDLADLTDPELPQVLIADHQTAGRGRRDRSWSAAPGSGLLFSVALRPLVTAAAAHLVTHAMAIAAAQACQEVAGVRVGLKWPNDLVVPGAGPDGADLKCAGILAESRLAGADIDVLIVGMGINVNVEAFPDELAATATALNLQAGREIDREELLVRILTRFGGLSASLGAPTALRERYRELCVTLGRRVRVELDDRSYEAIATDVTDTGHLVVRDDSGVTNELAVADIVHLRPIR